MNYLDRVTNSLREKFPDCSPRLIDFYALLALTKGNATTMSDVHDAWALWRRLAMPSHRSIIPFNELTVEVQELDRRYMEAIHKAAAA